MEGTVAFLAKREPVFTVGSPGGKGVPGC